MNVQRAGAYHWIKGKWVDANGEECKGQDGTKGHRSIFIEFRTSLLTADAEEWMEHMIGAMEHLFEG